MINSIKYFFQIHKYATAEFIIINNYWLVNRFSDRSKNLSSQTFFFKANWIG